MFHNVPVSPIQQSMKQRKCFITSQFPLCRNLWEFFFPPHSNATCILPSLIDFGQGSTSDLSILRQDTLDNGEWDFGKTATPTPNTGPQFDHTTGNGTGYYAFMESSYGSSLISSYNLVSPFVGLFRGRNQAIFSDPCFVQTHRVNAFTGLCRSFLFKFNRKYAEGE